jgi:hypothetical protein
MTEARVFALDPSGVSDNSQGVCDLHSTPLIAGHSGRPSERPLIQELSRESGLTV